jgi:sigma-B regulation protein RsbU (phosphoserine phosphatase)
MFQPTSLRKRLYAYLLIPVTILLLAVGTAGFLFSRSSMLNQWQKTAILRLERAAHQVDMRLMKVTDLMQLFGQAGGKPNDLVLQSLIVEKLKKLDGVKQVVLDWSNTEASTTYLPSFQKRGYHHGGMSDTGTPLHLRPFHRARKISVVPPVYDSVIHHETVTLISHLVDETDRKVGQLLTVLEFNHLIEGVIEAGWWQTYKAYLLDDSGKILICTDTERKKDFVSAASPLELKTFQTLKEKPFGTVMGKGHPPEEVAGFFRLHQAPWTFVMIAPGKVILEPIIDFRNYFFVFGTFFILVIVALIRFVTGRSVAEIKKVSEAAQQIAAGNYDSTLIPKTRDEVGELIVSFNQMIDQLEERSHLKEALHIAMEVQQNLLPQKGLSIDGIEISGRSIYCDETGGDYFDYFHNLGKEQHGITVAVGDVVGHGIGAALMMTTVRAMIRSWSLQPGPLWQKITDINRLLCMDTNDSGNFMTLFIAELNTQKRQIRWVRAGHDPALVYDPSRDVFEELKGAGVVLGFDDAWSYKQYKYEKWPEGMHILIGTDGIWETENDVGERFGKQRLQNVIRRHRQLSAAQLVEEVSTELIRFRGQQPQKDDITLVVIKIDQG